MKFNKSFPKLALQKPDCSLDCDINANCTNFPGGFDCGCNEGYNGTGFPGECENVDECSSFNLNDCDANATCTDLEGSYNCSCNAGTLKKHFVNFCQNQYQ